MIHALHLVGNIAFVVFNLEQRMACSPFQSSFIGRLPRPLFYMLSSAAFRRQWQRLPQRPSGWQSWKYSLIGPLQKKLASPGLRGQNHWKKHFDLCHWVLFEIVHIRFSHVPKWYYVILPRNTPKPEYIYFWRLRPSGENEKLLRQKAHVYFVCYLLYI